MSEQPTSTLAVTFQRPTIRVDEEEYAQVDELMVALEMTEKEGGLSALEMKLVNISSQDDHTSRFAFEDDEVLKLGARLTVYGGDVVAPGEIFRGVITGLEADYPTDDEPTLTVLAEDDFQRARMARRTRLYESVTIADVANAVARQIGLTPVIDGFSEDVGVQVQLNESDLAFLRRLLARHDSALQVVGDELHVAPRKDVARGTLELRLHSQLRRARVLADLAHQTTAVTAAGWDVASGRAINESSLGANFGPGRGRKGSEVLRDAVGERSEHLGHLVVRTSAEARAVAEAAFDSRARSFVTVEGTADGNPALRVGTTVTLRGLGGRFENDYYVTLARHRWDSERGYETDFTAECAFLGEGSA